MNFLLSDYWNNLYYLGDASVLYALAVALPVALCSALLGVMLVLKRYSMIGDGLSHIAFGAYAVAAACGLTATAFGAEDYSLAVTLPVTVAVAVLMLRTGNKKIKGESLIAMLSSGALALGYVLLYKTGSGNVSGDVCTSLFGGTAILTLQTYEVWLCLILSAIVVTVYVLFYNRMFSVIYDEDFCKAIGGKTELYKLILAVMTAVIVVLAMQLVGALLVAALIVFPALSAMRVQKSFRGTVITAAAMSVAATAVGFLLACLFELPIGSTVVLVNVAIFLGCTAINRFGRKK